MKHAAALLFVCMVALCAPCPGTAESSSWRDQDGTLHLTDQVAPPAADVPPGGDGATPPPADGPTSNESASRQTELARREARLAEREAYLELLQATAPLSNERLHQENLVVNEIRSERTAIDDLRRSADAAGAP